MSKILKFFLTLVLFFVILPLFLPLLASEFETVYKVNYVLKEQGQSISSKANFDIIITNTRSDVYVNKFAISFPKSFAISNLKVTDDKGRVEPVVETDDTYNKISMEFNSPNIGRGTVNKFNLTFDQANLFKVNGNVWEVILPVIENRGDSTYDVTVQLPEESSKKISIAKPRPTSINGREIKWSNPTSRTIYAVFGESQLYQADLAYHLKNTSIAPVSTEVAFPPDTTYQKVTLKSLSSQPAKTYQDSDGNYMAVYTLKPRETKTINAQFQIEVFSEPREEVIPYFRALFETQKPYLLNSQKYWEIKSLDKIAAVKTVPEVYHFVTQTLDYSYSRVSADNNVRFGAEKILENPKVAVCMEFTDLFVAASREKGIYAREIEGYGASSDPQLRPLSLSSDILHAWPEFYDEAQGFWRPVDPTWENTSGIDYFNSFDLNHVVFVIHGKRSDYPLPAGMYKVENSKDVEVTAVTERAEESEEIVVTDISMASRINDSNRYRGKFMVKNSGNIYVFGIPVEILGQGLTVSNPKTVIASLAPGEKREIVFDYQAVEGDRSTDKSISVKVKGHQLFKRDLVVSSLVFDILVMGTAGTVVVALVIIVVRKFKS